jgi:UDP-sugar transporter A1/2/3
VVIEALKMSVASILLAAQLLRRPQDRATFLSDRPLREFASYSVPAAIYSCTNNLGFLALLALHPTTTTIVGQSKVIFTGLFFRQMLKRRLSAWQWLALMTLMCALAQAVIGAGGEDTAEVGDTAAAAAAAVGAAGADNLDGIGAGISDAANSGDSAAAAAATIGDRSPRQLLAYAMRWSVKEQPLPLPAILGVGIVLLSSLLSALAAVYSELLLKSRMDAPIHWQNLQMYIHGTWINLLVMLLVDGPSIREHGLWHGYGTYAWANVLCTASMGLVMAALLKFLDNIARVYAAAVSMMVVLVASWPLFGVPISPQVAISIVTVVLSMVQYHLPPSFDRDFDRGVS